MNSYLTSSLLGAGLVFLWAGERVVDGGTTRLVTTVLGILLALAAAAARSLRMGRATSEARQVESTLLALHGLGVFAVLLYFWQSDVFAKVGGQTLETTSPKLAGVLAVLWPAVLVASLAPTLLLEFSYASMARAPKVELGRIREALLSGLGFAFALTFAFALQYVVTERDVKRDFSYFRMARPGDATKKLAQSFDEKVEVVLFFPPASDAAELVQAYFDEVKADAPLLTVSRLDYAVEPLKAKALNVTGNGTVVIKKGERKENLYMGVDVEKSRTQLRSLDQEVQKRLLQVGTSKRTVYLTAGHGERTQDALGGADQRATIDLVYRTLQDQNFEVRTLSTAEGLGSEVPNDAAAVFIIGPQKAFSEPEAKTLEAYSKRGGKLFIAIDPEMGLTFAELLTPLGLSFKPEVLANDQAYARLRATQSPSDRRNIGTRSFSSHPSVTYLSRYQAPVVLLGAGPIDELGQHPADLTIDFAVRALSSTWNDLNNNFEPNVPPEVRKSYGLMAAVSRRAASNKVSDELRALVLGDSDGIADDVLGGVQGNQLLIVDGLKWLLGEEQLQGATNSEQDVPLTRTKEQDNLWFYGTTLLAPLAVVGIGALARRRAPKKKPAEAKEAAS
ncbi:MAG: Gldg family protein [Archangium sp.]|nr:Gldg family protein [Archangium sp.]